MFGSRFASLRPEGLKKLVLANSAASKSRSIANSTAFRKELPQETQDLMKKHEDAKTTDSEEYVKIMEMWTREHVCNVDVPEDALVSIRFAREDNTVASAIGDLGWWSSDGYMREWDTSEDCKRIQVPTLLIHGVTECAGGEAMKPFEEGIPDVRTVTLEGSTHSPHVEVPDEYMRVVGEFLSGN